MTAPSDPKRIEPHELATVEELRRELRLTTALCAIAALAGLSAIASLVLGCGWLSGVKATGPGGIGLEVDGPAPAGASSSAVTVANKDSHATTESKRVSIGTLVVNIQKCGDAGVSTALADVVADAGGGQ